MTFSVLMHTSNHDTVAICVRILTVFQFLGFGGFFLHIFSLTL